MQEGTLEGFSLSPQQSALLRSLGGDERETPGVGCLVRITGAIDAEALERALGTLVARHEILRTSFPRPGGAGLAVQAIHAGLATQLAREDLSGADEATRSARLDELWNAGPGSAFDLAAEPALRARLVTLGPEDHRLYLWQPALCSDAGSLACLVRGLSAALTGAAEADEPMQYADLAQWQQELFDSEEAADGLAFWRAVDLGDADARLALERDGADGGTGFAPRERALELSTEVRAGLVDLADAHGLSLEALLFAAWQVLLHRHTEQDSLVGGLVSAGRSYEGLDVAFGPFARVLPVASTLSAEASLPALAAELQLLMHAAREWHEYFDLERVGGGRRFLPFVFEHAEAVEPLSVGGTRLALEARRVHAQRFRLKLTSDDVDGRLVLRLAHDATRMSAEAAAALLEQLGALLADAVGRPDAPAAELELLDARQRARVLALGATPAPEGDAGGTVVERIAENARRTPDAPAVRAADGERTYGELERRATSIAQHLRSLGVGPGAFVGLHLERGVGLVEALLGVLKAGAAYVPLPPGYPHERLAFMLADADVAVVLTGRKERAALQDVVGDRAVLVEDVPDAADAQAELAGPSPDDPAYVIYTSGSTGKPKGVPVAHGNLWRSTRARLAHYRRPVKSWLLLPSFAFDSSVAGIFWTLCQGGRLVLPGEGFERDVSALPAFFAEHGVTHVLALPSLYALILDHAAPGELGALETVIVAGESCPRELVERHRDALPDTELHNEYGPTEGTVWATVHDCGAPLERERVPIGRPVPGTWVRVLDGRGAPAPIGIAGEIHVGGGGVAPGYLGRPELTAERFVPDPFPADGAQPGGRVYRTGDRGRLLPDGTLEFLGRLDHQVKLRGYRIELEEIESVLADHPGVREVAAGVRPDAAGGERLVAWILPVDGLDAAALRAHLAGRLPEYMLPGAFVALADMPRLPNGKVDRSALPAPEEAGRTAAGAYVAPRTALERVLAGIWAELLGAERVGADDDFFELGGHSILATQVVARTTDMLQVELPLRRLFEHPTVASLAESLLADPAERPRVERTAELVLQVLGVGGEDDARG